MDKKTDNQILFYEAEDGESRVEVLYEGETVWLTQEQIARLLDTTRRNIGIHINNIYGEKELPEEGTRKKFFLVRQEGKRTVQREIEHYNLDMIISVGYRVNSRRGTQFRIWATKKLREYVIKGFVMDDERLKNGGSNYFDELYERVRHIRTSEANLYSKVTYIFTTSIDYSSSSQEAKTFYATVQNKFHYAIHGHTAAELIVERIDSEKDNLGLTTWKKELVTRKDAVIAKNYLTELEMKQLELLVEQFLSFAELRTVEKRPMYMADWVKKLDGFILLNEKEVLNSSGKVSRKEMESTVRKELEAYRERKMAEEALAEDEFYKMLDEAEKELLPPPKDDLEDDGVEKN